MPYYIFAWIASIAFGLETIIGKLTSKYTLSDPWVFNFVYPLIILFGTVPIALINHAGFPTHWGVLLIASFFSALAAIFYIFALFKLDVSIFSPLFNFRTAISVLLGTVFLGEILSLQQYILVAVIFIAGIFVSMDEKLSFKSFVSKPVGIALLDMLFLSLMSVFLKKAVSLDGYWTVALWVGILTQLMLLTTLPLFYKPLMKSKPKDYLGVLIMSLVGIVGSLASTKALSGNVSISTVIISLPISMFMAFIFSVIAPKLLEKHTIKIYLIRFVSAAVMIISALKLSS